MTKEAVIENVNSISPASIDGGVKDDFCAAWPAVKAGLQILLKVIPSLTFFINLVIAGGDALSAKICG